MSDEQLSLIPAEPPRTIDALLSEAEAIVESAKRDHHPVRTFLLFSGGNDSLVLLDALAPFSDEVIHVNTGIGIPETNEFARRVGASYGLPFTELHPPIPYDELVLGRWDGLPGPGAHQFTYQRLKERPIRQLLRDHRSRYGQRFLLLTGVRRAESKRRMGYRDPVDRRGGQVWVNPLLSWTHVEMRQYRDAKDLPVNEVAANLHMSGECLCGAMADQGDGREERAAIRFFYPEFDARLSGLETECVAAGKTYCEWGVKRPRSKNTPAGPMCQTCEFRFAGSEPS